MLSDYQYKILEKIDEEKIKKKKIKNIGHVMSLHRSDHMSQGSQISQSASELVTRPPIELSLSSQRES